MLVAESRFTITTALGTGWKTVPLGQTMLHHILVVPTNPTTVFDVQIINWAGDIVFEQKNIDSGQLNEDWMRPFSFNGTFKILNATNDETFTITLALREG